MFDTGTREERKKESNAAVTSSMMNTVIMVWNKRKRRGEREGEERERHCETPGNRTSYFLSSFLFISASRSRERMKERNSD